MFNVKFPLLGLSLLSLVACGEPLTKQQVTEQFAGNTVSKLSRLKAYEHLGSNDPSLGTRHIYHANDGRAFYTKNTPKGWRRTDSGRWWANENEICYSMRATLAEDHNGKQCSSAQVEVAFSSFERGDTQKLTPRRVAPKRTNNQSSGLGFSLSDVATIAGVGFAGATVFANVVCPSGNCSTPTASAPAPRSSGSGNSSASSPSSSASVSRGVKNIENWGRSPDGSSPQYKVNCTTRGSERYWQQGGQWYSGTAGAIGKTGWTINRLATSHCGG